MEIKNILSSRKITLKNYKSETSISELNRDLNSTIKALNLSSKRIPNKNTLLYSPKNKKNFIISELATTRENFKSKFNFHKESEINLMNILRLENEISDLNECLVYYDAIKNSEFKSDNLSKIHKVISNVKEKLILNDIAKFGFKDKDLMKRHYEDYQKNKWDLNYTTIQKLRAFI